MGRGRRNQPRLGDLSHPDLPEIPVIETYLLDRPLEDALGAGEASTGPTPGAIANAIFDATDVRVVRSPSRPSDSGLLLRGSAEETHR